MFTSSDADLVGEALGRMLRNSFPWAWGERENRQQRVPDNQEQRLNGAQQRALQLIQHVCRRQLDGQQAQIEYQRRVAAEARRAASTSGR